MFRKSVIPATFLFLLIAVTACYSSKLTINVLKPATYTLPAAVQRVTVYSEPGFQESPGQFDSLTDIRLDTETKAEEIKRGFLNGVYDIISASPRFKKVTLSDSSYSKLLSYGSLTWTAVDQICHHDTTDALLFLWKAVSYAARERAFSFYSQTDYPDFTGILNRTKWIFFSPDTHRQLASYSYNDTVSVAREIQTMQDLEDVLYQNCYVMGRAFGQKICPYWIEQDRTMYAGPGRELRKALAYTAGDRWNEAGSIWNKLAESPDKKQSSRAAFNLALAYERDDVLDQAVLWINYADSLYSTPASVAYKKILNDRLSVKPLLDEQMAGN